MNVEGRIWTANERLGPAWRFLPTDLAALAADQGQQELVHALLTCLKLLEVLEQTRNSTVDIVTRARPAAQNITFSSRTPAFGVMARGKQLEGVDKDPYLFKKKA